MAKLMDDHVALCTSCRYENFLSLEISVSYWPPVLQKGNQIYQKILIVTYNHRGKVNKNSICSFKIGLLWYIKEEKIEKNYYSIDDF